MKAKLLGLFALTAAALLLVVAINKSEGPVAADTPHSGLNFHIGMSDDGGIDSCSTSGTKGNVCSISHHRPVTVSVYLDSAGLPNYKGYQISIQYHGAPFGGGIQLKDILQTWPDCGATVGPSTPAPSSVTFGCLTSPWSQVSTYTGKIAEMAWFPCTSYQTIYEHHTIGLVHGAAGTHLIDGNGNTHAEGEGTTEDLDIVCANPTNTPTPSLPCSSVVLGDVDNNTQVNAIDALFVSQHVANGRNLRCLGNGNVDHSPTSPNPQYPADGITQVDGLLILQYVAGLISMFPPP